MPDSLRLVDFLDEEFLALVGDLGDYEGWVSTHTIAEAIQISARNVGSRLAWARKYGAVERNLQPGVATNGHWRLTEEGAAMVKAHFTQSQQKAVSSLEEEQLWGLSQELAFRYEAAGFTAANLIRRRFNASVQRRRFL